MSLSSIHLSDDLHQYLLEVSVDEHPALQGIRDATAAMPNSNMQIAAEQGRFMAFLIETIGARRTLEVGTFTGYSALAVSLALPEDGEVVACDLSDEWTSLGRPFWEEAGQTGKIDLRLGPALETLDSLISSGQSGDFDFAFIDADKTNYQGYLERCHTLVRTGGVIAVDNTLWSGRVADPDATDANTVAIRDFNAALAADARFSISLVPIGDGLTLARKL